MNLTDVLKNLKKWLFDVSVIFVGDKMAGGAGTAGGTKTRGGAVIGKALASRIFGIGTNDEFLIEDAFKIAELGLDVPHAELIELENNLIDLLQNIADHRKFRQIFGKEEGELTWELAKKIGYKTGNIEGARSIEIMSKMSKDELKIHLKLIGAFDTMDESIQSFVTTAKNAFNTLGGEKALEKLEELDAGREVHADRQEIRFRTRRQNIKAAKKTPLFARIWWVYAGIIIFAVISIISQKGIGTF